MPRNRFGVKRWLATCALLMLVGRTGQVLGAMGGAMVLPTGGKPTAGGLLLSVDSTWTDATGYRPVRVKLACRPAAGDRTLSVLISSDSWQMGRTVFSASGTLEIPAGSSSASATIPVPQFVPWQMLTVTTWLDGQKVDELCGNMGGLATYNQSGEAPSLLKIENGAGGVNVDAFYNTALPGFANTVAQGLSVVADLAELPAEWVNYTCFDVIAASRDDLLLLQAKNPAAWEAIRAWTAAGGNLCIYAVEPESHSELQRTLGIPIAPPSDVEVWREPDVESFRQEPVAPTFNDSSGVFEADSVTLELNSPSILPLAETTDFRWRELGLGRVVAIAEPEMFPLPGQGVPPVGALDRATAIWRSVLLTIGRQHRNWNSRHGFSFETPNPDYWKFLVPGVGLPPVGAYRVLITVFVVLIGPVNYLVLRRLRRLHLLLFIVPGCAAFVTVALLGYAVLADGLGVRLRARSYTHLDQRTGEAVTWSRLSYYAGLSPSEGLKFSRDTVIYPLQYDALLSSAPRNPRSTDWSDDQHLVRGWLPARTMTQLVAIRSGNDRKRLNIEPAGDKLKVTNQLGIPIEQLLIADENRRLFYTSGLAADQSLALVELPLSPETGLRTVPLEFGKALAGRNFDEPATATSRSLFGLRRPATYGNYGYSGSQDGPSLLETGLGDVSNRVRLANQPEEQGLAPRSYVAIMENCDPALRGVDNAEEQGGFHVLEARW